MDEVQHRLTRCFCSLFPHLASEQIRTASVQTVQEWDSLAAVTLVALLQEEFSVEVDLEDLPELESFDAVLRYLNVRNVSTNGNN